MGHDTVYNQQQQGYDQWMAHVADVPTPAVMVGYDASCGGNLPMISEGQTASWLSHENVTLLEATCLDVLYGYGYR